MKANDMHQHEAVLAVVNAYCRGVYHGNVELLRSVFDPRAQLFADVRGEPYFRPLEDYLAVVAGRQPPEALGQAFLMRPIAVEVTHKIACAKVYCPMYDYHYIDYLGLLHQGGEWKIVNKLFTDLPAREPA